MRRCNCCQRLVEITEASRFRTVLYGAHLPGGAFMYLGMWECRCQNTMSVVLWQDEQCCLDEAAEIEAEAEAAAVYQRDEEPINQACARSFFSLTHELASRGL